MSNEAELLMRSSQTLYCGPTTAPKWHNRIISKAASLPKNAFQALRTKYGKAKKDHKCHDASPPPSHKPGPRARAEDSFSFDALDHGCELGRTPTALRSSGAHTDTDSGYWVSAPGVGSSARWSSGTSRSTSWSTSGSTSRSTSCNAGVEFPPSASFGGRSFASACSKTAPAPEFDPSSLGIAMPCTSWTTGSTTKVALPHSASFGGCSFASAPSQTAPAFEFDPTSLGIAMPCTSWTTGSNTGAVLPQSTSFGGRSFAFPHSKTAPAFEFDPSSLGIEMPRLDANARTILPPHHHQYRKPLPRRPPAVVRRGRDASHLPVLPVRCAERFNGPARYGWEGYSAAIWWRG